MSPTIKDWRNFDIDEIAYKSGRKLNRFDIVVYKVPVGRLQKNTLTKMSNVYSYRIIGLRG